MRRFEENLVCHMGGRRRGRQVGRSPPARLTDPARRRGGPFVEAREEEGSCGGGGIGWWWSAGTTRARLRGRRRFPFIFCGVVGFYLFIPAPSFFLPSPVSFSSFLLTWNSSLLTSTHFKRFCLCTFRFFYFNSAIFLFCPISFISKNFDTIFASSEFLLRILHEKIWYCCHHPS
jgi:hypothetical protein